MRPLRPTPERALPILSAVASVALADGALEPRERGLLAALAEAFELEVDPAALAEPSPDGLAAAVTDPDERRAVVERMVLVALLDEVARPEEIAKVRAYAAALEVDEPSVEQMELAARGRGRCLAIDLVRRGFLGQRLRDEWDARGLGGLFRALRALSGSASADVAARYQALGELSPGTLGRAYFDHMRREGYALPGEPEGAPELVLFHDLGHALTGYTTDVAGEIRMAGFEAGYMREDGFSVAALALFAFHMGVPLPKVQAARGAFDYPSFERAWHVGRGLSVDLRAWDAWPHMARPLDDVRRELGLAG